MASIETNMRDGRMNHFLIGSGNLIEKGNPVFIKEATGYAFTPTVSENAAAGDDFVGIAVETVSNVGKTAPAEYCRVWSVGVHRLPATGFAQASVGDYIKVAADGTFALGAAGYNIGTLVERSATTIDVKIDKAFGLAYA